MKNARKTIQVAQVLTQHTVNHYITSNASDRGNVPSKLYLNTFYVTLDLTALPGVSPVNVFPIVFLILRRHSFDKRVSKHA